MTGPTTTEPKALTLPPAVRRKADRFAEGVQQVVDRADGLTVDSQEHLEDAGEHLKGIKELHRAIGEFIDPFHAMAKDHYQGVLRRRKALLKPLELAEEELKGRVTNYLETEEQRRLEERRQIMATGREAAQARQEELAADAEAHDEQGRADRIRAAPVTVQPSDLPALPPEPEITMPEGVQVRKKWKAQYSAEREDSLRILLQAILDGKPGAHLELIEVNWTEADKLADAHKENLSELGLGLQGFLRRDVAVRT